MMPLHVTRAEKIFGVRFPCAADDLKQAYRRVAMVLHPGKGGDAAAFKEMYALYEELRRHAELFVKGAASAQQHQMTLDGAALADLGKGFGPTRNGRTCGTCSGRGWTSGDDVSWKSCPLCRGVWSRIDSFYKVLGFRLGRAACGQCNGLGEIQFVRGKLYHMCVTCRGLGEVELFNPVLKKGAVAGRR